MSASRKRMLGLVTIGQSPRDDIVSQMLPLLPVGLDIRQVEVDGAESCGILATVVF